MIRSLLLNQTDYETPPLAIIILTVILIVFTVVLTIIMTVRGTFTFLEKVRVTYFKKKQFFTHVYLKRNKLAIEHKAILQKEFDFYKRLSLLEKKNFEHRLNYYIENWEFIGKESKITNSMQVLISATAAKLTFGYRDYKIECIDKVIIYDKAYYSTMNKDMHKGEFNMAYNALVFSWEDFVKGYNIEDDNMNLGVHECIHAMHFSFLKSRSYSTSAAIFLDSFQELTQLVDTNEVLKQKLTTSGYFRDYAFENQFEFVSVLVENFIETPSEFRSEFPKIYDKVKQMLNFNFPGY
ncbi:MULTISPECIES: zinc-dependent peptidase [unclassified Lacinutrix]